MVHAGARDVYNEVGFAALPDWPQRFFKAFKGGPSTEYPRVK